MRNKGKGYALEKRHAVEKRHTVGKQAYGMKGGLRHERRFAL